MYRRKRGTFFICDHPVNGVESLLALSLWFFVITHLDTLVLLLAFCTDERYRVGEIAIGHYLGFSIGLAGALVGSFVVGEFLREFAFLLGFVPLALGLWGLFRRGTSNDHHPRIVPSGRIGRMGVVTVAGIGLSGENIAVFVPFFATLSTTELLGVTALYLIAAGVLFVLALFISRRPETADLPAWVEEWAAPVSLVLVGLYVLSAGWVAV